MPPPSRSSSGRVFLSPIFAIVFLFYIFSSTALAASAVLGVDLGTEYIKAALVKPGIPLEIEGIVVNQFQAQAKLPREVVQQLKDEGLPVLNHMLPPSVLMKEP